MSMLFRVTCGGRCTPEFGEFGNDGVMMDTARLGFGVGILGCRKRIYVIKRHESGWVVGRGVEPLLQHWIVNSIIVDAEQ